MLMNVKVKFSGGVLRPLEPLNLEEGKEVTVSIEDVPSSTGAIQALRASAGGWVGSHDPDELKRTIYEARVTGSRMKLEP